MKTMSLTKCECFVTYITVAVVAVLAPPTAMAGLRWCYTDHPDAVFCDDFDQYCCSEYLGCDDGAGLPPTPNHTCEPVPGAGCAKANDRALAVWVPIQCGAVINLDEGSGCTGSDSFVSTDPFGAKYPKGLQGYHTVDLASHVNEKYGYLYNAMNGTDENPLVLKFILNGQTDDKIRHANTYIELRLLDAVNYIDHHAPTDYIFGGQCVYEPEEIDYNHPIICQQNVPPAGCPDIADAPHHGSIAVGAVANLDDTPCDEPAYIPTNYHLSIFDGHKWWKLPAEFPGEGEFIFGDGPNQITLTLKSTEMKVELTDSQGVYSHCAMPRDYEGAFNRLSMGFWMSCLIDLGSWTCAKTPGTDRVYTCINSVMLDKGHPQPVGPVYDNVALYGGEAYELPMPKGACCLTNGECLSDITQYECEMIEGGTWQGTGSLCAESICCPEPFADADGDGDVDHQDFGLFQACFTGPGPVSPAPSGKCTCFDRSFWAVGDADVDDLDFDDFEACFSGPTVPADPTCDDELHM